MSDELILDSSSAGSSTPREQHPTGQAIGVCVDVIDLGERVSDFPGKPARCERKVAFVWQTGQKTSEGELFELSKEFTFSGHEKSTLRKVLGEWRGLPVTDDEVKAGMRLSQYVGKPCILTLVPKQAKNGNVYTNIGQIAPLFPGLIPPALPQYTRKEFWGSKKTEYADAAAEFKRKQAVASGAGLPAPQSQIPAPVAPVSNEAAVAGMVAAENAQQAELPPF